MDGLVPALLSYVASLAANATPYLVNSAKEKLREIFVSKLDGEAAALLEAASAGTLTDRQETALKSALYTAIENDPELAGKLEGFLKSPEVAKNIIQNISGQAQINQTFGNNSPVYNNKP